MAVKVSSSVRVLETALLRGVSVSKTEGNAIPGVTTKEAVSILISSFNNLFLSLETVGSIVKTKEKSPKKTKNQNKKSQGVAYNKALTIVV